MTLQDPLINNSGNKEGRNLVIFLFLPNGTGKTAFGCPFR